MRGADEAATLLAAAPAVAAPATRRSGRRVVLGAACVAAVMAALSFRRPRAGATALSAATATVSFTVSNEYPAPKSLFRYPWSKLAEPYKDTILSVAGPDGASRYRWAAYHVLRGARTLPPTHPLRGACFARMKCNSQPLCASSEPLSVIRACRLCVSKTGL